MTERDQHHHQDDQNDGRLRAHLRSADPAATLAPADPATVAGLARAAMADDDSRRVSAAPSGPEGRRRVPQLLAAAAVVVVAGLGVWAVAGPDGSEDPGDVGSGVALDPAPTGSATTAPSARPSATAPSARASATAPGPGADVMTVLRVPATAAAKCMVPNADVLRGQDLAFEGTVTSVDGSLAVLDASEVYAGAVSDVVRVQAPAAEMSLMLAGVQFEVGKTYLVSATGGQVTLCGLTAEVSPELVALYAEAYGR